MLKVEIKTITIELDPDDVRFGFSVVGGYDAGFPPRIDEISEGNLKFVFLNIGRNILRYAKE